MTWEEEVQQAAEEVRREFTDPRLNGVTVLALEAYGETAQWGSFEPARGIIRIFRPAYDQMPDQENRATQLRAVLRHEFAHVMGHPGHLGDRQPPPEWYGTKPFVIEGPDGIFISLPESSVK
jgi:hypothetical protein